eukprot:98240-Karenia_brevis.AAC.1
MVYRGAAVRASAAAALQAAIDQGFGVDQALAISSSVKVALLDLRDAPAQSVHTAQTASQTDIPFDLVYDALTS